MGELSKERIRRLFLQVIHNIRSQPVAALFYTLFESAKLSGVEPKAYVLKAATAAIRKPGTITLPQDLLDPNPT